MTIPLCLFNVRVVANQPSNNFKYGSNCLSGSLPSHVGGLSWITFEGGYPSWNPRSRSAQVPNLGPLGSTANVAGHHSTVVRSGSALQDLLAGLLPSIHLAVPMNWPKLPAIPANSSDALHLATGRSRTRGPRPCRPRPVVQPSQTWLCKDIV